jgi:hypothetical protein
MIVDLSQLPSAISSEIVRTVREDFDQKLLQAVDEQKAVAAWYHQNPVPRHDLIGAAQTAVNPLFDWVARQVYGEDARDPAFWKWAAKQDDSLRVPTQPGRIRVGYTGPPRQVVKRYAT